MESFVKSKLLGLMFLSSTFYLNGCATNTSINTSDIRTQIAIEHIRLGNVDLAKNALDEAIERNPNNAMANMMLGVTLQLVGTSDSLKSAEPYFSKAINIEPNNAQIRNNYGQYLFILERYEDAIKQFKIAANTIGYNGRDVALNNLGQCYLRLEKYDDSKNFFLRTLHLNPKNPEALLGLSETYYLQTNSDAAADVFQDYVNQIGRSNLDAKALWLGLRIDRMNNNMISMREHTEELGRKYPKSSEFNKYLMQRSNATIWR